MTNTNHSVGGNDHSATASSVANIDRDALVDISDIQIDDTVPFAERILNYLAQIKNPYIFKSHGVVVRLEFADTSTTIEDRLEQYIQQKQIT